MHLSVKSVAPMCGSGKVASEKVERVTHTDGGGYSLERAHGAPSSSHTSSAQQPYRVGTTTVPTSWIEILRHSRAW